jgi:hypothetical protein
VYPIKRKLKERSMIKNYMITGALTKKVVMPFPGEEAVMSI